MQCLKESFIKAVGSGLSFGLQNLEFKVEPEEDWPPSLGVCVQHSRIKCIVYYKCVRHMCTVYCEVQVV